MRQRVSCLQVWGEELIVVHGGIGEDKQALRCAGLLGFTQSRATSDPTP